MESDFVLHLYQANDKTVAITEMNAENNVGW
jgi:hypothetical protein